MHNSEFCTNEQKYQMGQNRNSPQIGGTSRLATGGTGRSQKFERWGGGAQLIFHGGRWCAKWKETGVTFLHNFGRLLLLTESWMRRIPYANYGPDREIKKGAGKDAEQQCSRSLKKQKVYSSSFWSENCGDT